MTSERGSSCTRDNEIIATCTAVHTLLFLPSSQGASNSFLSVLFSLHHPSLTPTSTLTLTLQEARLKQAYAELKFTNKAEEMRHQEMLKQRLALAYKTGDTKTAEKLMDK